MLSKICRPILTKSKAPELLQKIRCVNFRTSKPFLGKTKYGGRYLVSMIIADDFGYRLMAHVKDIFECARVPVDFEEVHLCSKTKPGEARRKNITLHDAVASIKRNGVAIKSNIYTEHGDFRAKSRNVILRKKLNLFANVLHCKSQPGIRTRHNNLDLVLVRQNTEGEYSCLEHRLNPGVVESLKIITSARSEEISRFAFHYAALNGRNKITAVHKATVMPESDGLFLDKCKAVAEEYPKIQFDTMSLGTCCCQLVAQPQGFDVLLLTNLYGNVLSNVACGLIGGAGVASGQNYGHDCAVFEIGSRSSVILDNPVPLINASVDLLRYMGLETYAKVIEISVHKTLSINRILTPDLGGTAEASDVVDNIKKVIQGETSRSDQ